MNTNKTLAALGLSSLILCGARQRASAVDDDPMPPHAEPTEEEICTARFEAKRTALLASGINVGSPVGPVVVSTIGDYCFQVYTAGRIYSTVLGGGSLETAVYGAILAEYATVGYEASFGRPLTDPQPTSDAGARRSKFLNGIIDSHPTLGTHSIRYPLGGLWISNGADTGRFGYPTTDPVSMPGNVGNATTFEVGYGAQVNGMGAWLDFTGTANEGRTSGSVALFDGTSFTGTSQSRSLSSEAPVAFAAQLGAINNLASSVSLNIPRNSELFLFDGSPLSGRGVGITGATAATVRVSDLGAFMTNRTSSMLLVNHGAASVRMPATDLRDKIEDAIDALDTSDLIDSGSLAWTTPVTLQLVPGERTLRITRRAYLNVNAPCGPYDTLTCDADGEVELIISLRPMMDGPLGMRVGIASAQVNSLACNSSWFDTDDEACIEREERLDNLFADPAVTTMILSTFNSAIDDELADLASLASFCNGVSVRRIHVLPSFLEIVIADTADVATCAKNTATNFGRGDAVNTDRPAARVQNSDGSPFTGSVSLIPLFPFPVTL
jgi:hypothetical protein